MTFGIVDGNIMEEFLMKYGERRLSKWRLRRRMIILWNYVIVWILVGCVTAGWLTWFCDVWTEKKISFNLLIGMLIAIALGWIGLIVMLGLLGLAFLVNWFENHGNSAAISWGKPKSREEFPLFTDDQLRRLKKK